MVITLLLKEEVWAAASTTTEVLFQDQATIWFRNPNIVAVWTLQMADNVYSVSLFLYNLHVRARPLKSSGLIDMQKWLRMLLLINYYVIIMGALCATIWFSRSEWAQTCKEPLSNEMLLHKLNLPRAPAGVWMGGSEVIVTGKTHSRPGKFRW
ncbi:hypothetical protein EDC04DRAFT_2603555 [Pisolithus marmoratus]|nr:hypothetical protein EDC04DRAFT_2603555 [Pisolithus marmoratus]